MWTARTELDIDRIESDGIDNGTEVGVGKRTLRRSGDIVPLASTGRMRSYTVHKRDVIRRPTALNVEIDAIEYGWAKRTRWTWSTEKDVPDVVRESFSLRIWGKGYCACRTTDTVKVFTRRRNYEETMNRPKRDDLSSCLTCLDIARQSRTVREFWPRKRGVIIWVAYLPGVNINTVDCLKSLRWPDR